MTSFRIVASGANLPEPLEKVAATAVEAESPLYSLLRRCGLRGSVEVFGERGRLITREALAAKALAEKTLAKGNQSQP